MSKKQIDLALSIDFFLDLKEMTNDQAGRVIKEILNNHFGKNKKNTHAELVKLFADEYEKCTKYKYSKKQKDYILMAELLGKNYTDKDITEIKKKMQTYFYDRSFFFNSDNNFCPTIPHFASVYNYIVKVKVW